MAPRVSLPLASLRRSASTVRPSGVVLLPPSAQQAASTAQLLHDVRSTVVAVDETVHKESAWPARVDEALVKLDGQLAAGELVGGGQTQEMEIAVFSPPLAGSRDLVTALLEDPLDPDLARQIALRERANGSQGAKNQPLTIRYGPSAFVDADGLALPSTFLQGGRLSIRELPASTPPSTLYTTLLLSPLPILVIDNLRLLSSHPPLVALLPSLLRHPQLRLVVNTISDLTSPTSPTTTLSSFESRVWTEIDRCVGGDKDVLDSLRSRVHVVGAKRAVRAVDAWREGQKLAPGKAREDKVELFQREYVGSHIDELKADLGRASQPSAATIPAALPPHLSATVFLAQLAVLSSSYDLLDLSSALKDHAEAAADVRKDAGTAAAQFVEQAMVMPARVGDVGGVTHAPRSVSEAVASSSKQQVGSALQHLSFGRLLTGAVDDVGWEVGEAVKAGWGGEGEKALVLSTATLHSTSQSLAAPLTKLLQHPPSPALHSALLNNSLPPSPSPSPLPTSLLLAPLTARRNTLLAPAGPVEVLQQRAYKATTTAYFTSIASVSGAYGGGLAGLWEGPTALGVGALATLAGVRWGMAKWAKAQRRFWRDWARVEAGLEVDLRNELTIAASQHLLVRPLAAADAMEELVRRQSTKVDERMAEVEVLKARVADLQMGQAVSTSLPTGQEQQSLR